MGHKDDSGKTFGPGNTGWYYVQWTPEPNATYVPEAKPCLSRTGDLYGHVKTSSAFKAAAHFSRTLANCHVTFITNTAIIDRLEDT